MAEKLKPVLGRVENIVGKGENAGYQHFLPFPQCFQKPSLSGSLKVGIVWERVKPCENETVKSIYSCQPASTVQTSIGNFFFIFFMSKNNSLPDDQIFDWSKLKQTADNSLKCISNGKKVTYKVENIVRKGEMACYKQFLLFSQCFQQL